jgi:hypothetical protein
LIFQFPVHASFETSFQDEFEHPLCAFFKGGVWRDEDFVSRGVGRQELGQYWMCVTTHLDSESLILTKSVLLEAPFDPLRRQMNSVLLTIDLTRAVADEAIERKDSVIIAYR